MKKQLYDINTVCKMLNITSRTLRFWEEKGLLSGIKAASGRRQYTDEQIDSIKRIITLRKLGLSLKEIKAINDNETDLKTAVSERRAAVYAAIEKKQQEISALCDALALIENGMNLYDAEMPPTVIESRHEEIASRCAAAIVYNDEALLYSYFSEKMKKYLPPDVYRSVRLDVLSHLGDFIKFGKLTADKRYKNSVFQYAEYEKRGLRIQFVFHGEKIEGLWLTYYEP